MTGVLFLAACSPSNEEASTTEPTTTAAQTSSAAGASETQSAHSHDHSSHPADGGAAPAGIAEADSPTFPVGSEVKLLADHMPGMQGATATIAGAFHTTTYAVTYTPTTGGEPVEEHRWVVHEELHNPDAAPLPDGTQVVLDADHMQGMKGATATIDYSTSETVYMVDYEADGMTMTNHKWVTESEIQPLNQ
ncbi:MAG: YdhK family protein [Corynebacterium sp.]|nr:YdhK family protein [Corynebacterium sp.]